MRVFYMSPLLLLVTGCGTATDVSNNGADGSGGSMPEVETYLYQPVMRELSWEATDYHRKLSATVSRGEIVYTIAFTETKFDESAHDIEFEEYGTIIDGRIAHGVDGGSVPEWELSKIEVELDGEVVLVPEDLYSDCYDFELRRFANGYDTYIEGVILRILDDGVLQVSALASDAAGTYLVHWWFGGNQPAVRRIAGSEAEMHSVDDNWKTEVPERPIVGS